MNNLQIIVWDVGHGLSVSLLTPEVLLLGEQRRRWIQFDANNNSETNFSPITHLYSNGWRTMDYLIISHPDQDHIGDLPVLQNLRHRAYDPLSLRVLSRNTTLPSYIISENPSHESQAKTTYRSFDAEYCYTTIPDIDQLVPANFGGIVANSACLDFSDDLDENDCSLLFSIQFDNMFLVLPGDMTSFGFTRLVEENRVQAPMESQIVIIMAPHHGSETVEAEALLQFYKPHIVLASVGDQDTNSDPIFSGNLVRGYPVDGEYSLRKFLTTRQNNALMINATPNSFPQISLLHHN